MRAMIMAAGLGTRLWPLTGFVPKPMAPILDRPALHHIVTLLRRHGVTEIVVNLHHFPSAITSYLGDGSSLGVSIRYAYEEELMGTAGGVKNNEDFLADGTFLIMSGDSLTDLDLQALVAAHRARGGIATLAVKRVDDPSDYGVIVTGPDGRVTGFQEKPSVHEARSDLCNAGIYVFEPEIFERVPADTFYDFGKQVFPGLLESGDPFYVHEIDGYWNDVGSLDEYRAGNFDALRGHVRVEAVGGSSVAGEVRVGARSDVASTASVVGEVLVGADCVVEEGATLRGPLVLGDHCTVARGAVLESSIVWGGCYVGPGSRLVDAILGRDVFLQGRVTAAGAVVGGRSFVAEGHDLGERLIEPESVVM